jgi:hypothetical protein
MMLKDILFLSGRERKVPSLYGFGSDSAHIRPYGGYSEIYYINDVNTSELYYYFQCQCSAA